MADSALLKASVVGLRAKAAKPKTDGDLADTAMAVFGLGGVGTAMAVTRVKELMAGNQMSYKAFLNLEELAGRLRTLMGDKYRVTRLLVRKRSP